MDGLDGPLRTTVVTDDAARLLDAGGEGRLGDEAVAPHVVEQLLLGDQPTGLFDQVLQDREDLGFELGRAVGTGDLEAVGVDDVPAEPIAGHRDSALQFIDLGDGIEREPESLGVETEHVDVLGLVEAVALLLVG